MRCPTPSIILAAPFGWKAAWTILAGAGSSRSPLHPWGMPHRRARWLQQRLGPWQAGSLTMSRLGCWPGAALG